MQGRGLGSMGKIREAWKGIRAAWAGIREARDEIGVHGRGLGYIGGGLRGLAFEGIRVVWEKIGVHGGGGG